MPSPAVSATGVSATLALSRWMVESDYATLPQNVIDHIKWCVIDTVACGLGGRATPEADALIRMADRLGEGGKGTVFGERGRRFSILQAAQINRVLINILDYDDTIIRTGHMSTVAVATALAVGENVKADGRAIIAALAMAYEGVLRLRTAIDPTLEAFRTTFERVDTGVPFCATIAAGKLLGLDAERMAGALGLTGHIKPWHVTTPPMGEFGMPAWFKVTQGDGVIPGIQAAFLAADGFPGDTGIFDEDRGYERQVGSDRFNAEPLLRGADPNFELLDIGFKHEACCRHISAFAEALTAIQQQHKIGADDIASIEVRAHRWTVENLKNPRPAHMIGAQFSMPHCLAMTALGVPTGMAWFRDDALQDPTVDALRRRVRLVHDERAQRIYDQEKRYAGEVAVTSKNGAVLTHFCPAPRGALGNPFSEEDHHTKLSQMAAQAGLSAAQTEALWTMLRELESVEDISALTALLVPSP